MTKHTYITNRNISECTSTVMKSERIIFAVDIINLKFHNNLFLPTFIIILLNFIKLYILYIIQMLCLQYRKTEVNHNQDSNQNK